MQTIVPNPPQTPSGSAGLLTGSVHASTPLLPRPCAQSQCCKLIHPLVAACASCAWHHFRTSVLGAAWPGTAIFANSAGGTVNTPTIATVHQSGVTRRGSSAHGEQNVPDTQEAWPAHPMTFDWNIMNSPSRISSGQCPANMTSAASMNTKSTAACPRRYQCQHEAIKWFISYLQQCMLGDTWT